MTRSAHDEHDDPQHDRQDDPQERERAVATIAEWITAGEHVVAFTSAGISTDSGIPDFRGPDGAWTRRDAGLPAPRWRVAPGQVAPNASHLALVELERLGKLQYLITQNTDGLHRESGIQRQHLAELHGNERLLRCPGRREEYGRQAVGWDPRRFGPGYRTDRPVPGQPACAACGGRLISSVVSFGDPLPALCRRSSWPGPGSTPVAATSCSSSARRSWWSPRPRSSGSRSGAVRAWC